MARVEILTGLERRRSWSDDEKLAILSEPAIGEETVAEIARRHDILAPQIYAWRRKFRHAAVMGKPATGPVFLPVTAVPTPASPTIRSTGSKNFCPGTSSWTLQQPDRTATLMRLMLGRDLSNVGRSPAADPGQPVVLEVRRLTHQPSYRDISFQVRAGEIVGFAGLVGAGRSEVMPGLFGSPLPEAGEIRIDGQPTGCHRSRCRGHCQGYCAVAGRSQTSESGTRPFGFRQSGARRPRSEGPPRPSGFCRRAPARRRLCQAVAYQDAQCRCEGRQSLGGNQQKVVLAKWLATNPRVLIVDEPTRGVDVGSKAQIYAFLRELAAAGLAIIVVSSDLPEVIAISNRILVMRDGRLVGELQGTDADEEKIMALAALDQTADDAGARWQHAS